MTVTWLEEIPESEWWMVQDRPFRIGDIEYLSTMRPASVTTRLCVKKPPGLVEATVALLREHAGGNILELGISQGGSTALFTQVGRPRKLVAIELNEQPVESLENFIDAADARDVVKPYYGVDQSDRQRIREIIDAEFGDEPIDLVIDDASHLLDETRASFEAIFPRLREGGLFIIEDWNWEHVRAAAYHRELAKPGSALATEFNERLREALSDPESREHAAFVEWLGERAQDPDAAPSPRITTRTLTILVMELLMARAWSGDVISELAATDLWVTVRKGPAELDAERFRVADIAHDDWFGLLPRNA
jgi:predicted O-methyltransferase YrrM